MATATTTPTDLARQESLPPLLVTLCDRDGNYSRTIEMADPRENFCREFNEFQRHPNASGFVAVPAGVATDPRSATARENNHARCCKGNAADSR